MEIPEPHELLAEAERSLKLVRAYYERAGDEASLFAAGAIRWRLVSLLAAALAAIVIALASSNDFVNRFADLLAILLYLFTPWTAINLVDYYLLRRGEYDVAAFFRRDGGIYGLVNGPAVFCYALGIVIQIPFVATKLYTGPIARSMGGIDLSWLVGLLITSPAYYWLARSAASHRAGSMVAAPVSAAP